MIARGGNMRIIFLATLLMISPVFGLLKVQVKKGVFSPVPIAISNFSSQDSNIGESIRGVITNDLSSSGLFNTIPKDAHIQTNFAKGVRFSDWKVIKADGLVYGFVESEGSTITVTVKLIDVFAETEITSLKLKGPKSGWRKLAHTIANQIYERLTGEAGYFNTKIAYVAESGPSDKRTKRLAIADYDGANYKLLTSGRAMIMTPRFSKNGNKIAYYSIVNRKGNIYILNLDNNTTELLGQFDGLSYAPRFSEDGKFMLFSIASGMSSHIYEMNLKTRQKRRLTRVPALNTSPYYSPDGSKIVFVSNRSGSAQLYVVDRDGEAASASAKRLTFASGSRYYTPVFSPNGKYIAFTKVHGGTFFVGLMRPDGTGERTIAQGFFVEAPTWSPNSQMLMYTRRTPVNKRTRSDVARIYMIHVTGFGEKEVITPTNATDPEWSGNL
jgi:TolB protein